MISIFRLLLSSVLDFPHPPTPLFFKSFKTIEQNLDKVRYLSDARILRCGKYGSALKNPSQGRMKTEEKEARAVKALEMDTKCTSLKSAKGKGGNEKFSSFLRFLSKRSPLTILFEF